MPSRTFRRELRKIYFAPFFAMTLLAAVVLWRIEGQVSVTQWVEHSDRVLLRAQQARLAFDQMRLATLSYLLSPNSVSRDDLEKARSEFQKALEDIAILVADNSDQEQGLVKIGESFIAGTLENLVQQRERGTMPADALQQLRVYNQKVSSALDEFIAAENQLRERRLASQRRLNQAIIFSVLAVSALTAVILSFLGWRQIDRASHQFATALALAEQANRAKDTFLATISHDLRNPLNSIMLLTGVLLSDADLPEKTHQRVQGIDRAARTQAQLIDDLLDVSRIESGRLRLDVQATDLAEVVKAGVDSMRTAAEAKSIALTDVIDTSVSLIAGDPRRLEQVVWNLVSNAIKFTPKGGKVQVRLERINSHVELIVADNGAGIATASLPFIFDRFWQEPGIVQAKPGVGLGLSIVKELVALHGGSVTAHSEGPGKGSTFTVRLPLPPATTPLLEPRRHPTVASPANVTAATRLDGLSILVVDDETEACEALRRLLGNLGAVVAVETSVQGGLKAFDRGRPDAIIADIEMPIEDGFAFAREVRRREHEHKLPGRVPLLALTAYGRVDDKVKILASGFDSHVIKPVDLAEVSATLRSLVTARAA